MVVVVFRNRLNPGTEAEYGPLADEMLALVRTMPGFVSLTAFTSEDGERLALAEFESIEHVRAWGRHPQHQIAQRAGIDRLYSEYTLQVCGVERESRFDAKAR